MRVLAVSDRVVEHLYASDVAQRYSGIDLILGCGDLPYYYLDFLVSALDARLAYVRGNHDGGPQYTVQGQILTAVPGGIDLHGRVVTIDGLILAGLEGSMRYRPQAPLMYTEREMTWNVLQLVPRLWWNRHRFGRALDVLVAHSPPYGIHDQRDIAHTGFKVFRSFLKRFKPRYFLHGHIHVYRNDVPRVTRFHETTVINVYPYRQIDFSELKTNS
ncbi:MAG: metallophosphoesterase [Candidatus Promineifilaceae bacterium]|nr:metallophosphoesterase [Candidatus Promineifilaceae bacterium]